MTSGEVTWETADTGMALMEEFAISCKDWVDRNGHAIVKYLFKSESTLGRVFGGDFSRGP